MFLQLNTLQLLSPNGCLQTTNSTFALKYLIRLQSNITWVCLGWAAEAGDKLAASWQNFLADVSRWQQLLSWDVHIYQQQLMKSQFADPLSELADLSLILFPGSLIRTLSWLNHHIKSPLSNDELVENDAAITQSRCHCHNLPSPSWAPMKPHLASLNYQLQSKPACCVFDLHCDNGRWNNCPFTRPLRPDLFAWFLGHLKKKKKNTFLSYFTRYILIKTGRTVDTRHLPY